MLRECKQCKVAKPIDTNFSLNTFVCRECYNQEDETGRQSSQSFILAGEAGLVRRASQSSILAGEAGLVRRASQSSILADGRPTATPAAPQIFTAGYSFPATASAGASPYISPNPSFAATTNFSFATYPNASLATTPNPSFTAYPSQAAPVAQAVPAAAAELPPLHRQSVVAVSAEVLSHRKESLLRDPLPFLQELFNIPEWVPMTYDSALARLFCRMVYDVVELEKSEKGLSLQSALEFLHYYFAIPIEEAAVIEVFAIPNEIVYQCYKTEGWLGRALVASFNSDLIEPAQFDLKDVIHALTKCREVRRMLADFLVDMRDQKPLEIFQFAMNWVAARAEAEGITSHPHVARHRTGFEHLFEYELENGVKPRLTRVMREFLIYLSHQNLDDVYVTVHVAAKDLDPVQTDVYGLPPPKVIPALEWVQKRLNFLSKPHPKAKLSQMTEEFIQFLIKEDRYPFANPVLSVIKRISTYIALHHSLPPIDPAFTLDAEALLMHELKMPLSLLISNSGQKDGGQTWLGKVGLYMMERIPSSHPLIGNSPVTGKKTSYNEAKGLLGRMTDRQIYETFESLLASGFGAAIHAVLPHDGENQNHYAFVVVMVHYLWYLKQKEQLMDNVKSEDMAKTLEQFNKMTGPPYQSKAKVKLDEKAILLSLRSQHFLTALMQATLFGSTPLVQTMLIHSAKSDSPIQESVLKQLFEYLLQVYYCLRRTDWRCFKCGRYVPEDKDAKPRIAKCNQCDAAYDITQGLYCSPCPFDSCNECMTYITDGPNEDLAFICGRCRDTKIQPTQNKPIKCAICKKDTAAAKSLQCADCSYEVCANCQILQAVSEMAHEPLTKKILHLLKILSKLGFEASLKTKFPDLFSQFKTLPALTPLLLHDLEDVLQKANSKVQTMADLVPDFRWFPHSAHFLAEVTGFADVINAYKSNGLTLTDFEKDELVRYQKLRKEWLQGSTCCARAGADDQHCACGFSQAEDQFFMDFVRLGKPQPKAEGPFVDFLVKQMAEIWPDLFPNDQVSLWLAQTRTTVLLKLLQPKYGPASGDLAPRNIAAVFLYTLQTPIYQKLNAAFYMKDEKQQKNWQPFTDQLCKAIEALPDTKFVDRPFSNFASKKQCASFRGVGPSIDPSKYAQGKTVTLENFTSTSVSGYIAHCFGSEGTIMVTKLKSYKLISRYSDYPNEQEFLTPPGSQFKVTRAYRSPDFKSSEVASTIIGMIYFYFAMTQNNWDDVQWLLDEEAYGYSDPNELPETLEMVEENPLRSFHLMFDHLSYNLVFLEEL